MIWRWEAAVETAEHTKKIVKFTLDDVQEKLVTSIYIYFLWVLSPSLSFLWVSESNDEKKEKEKENDDEKISSMFCVCVSKRRKWYG